MGVAEAAQSLLGPWLFMASSAYYLPGTIIRLIRNRQWSSLFRWSRFQPEWFSAFWRWAGARIREGAGPTVVIPLLQGRVRHGRVLEEGEKKKMAPPVSGTVIEVGPGNGMWVSVFSEIRDSAKSSKSSSGSSSKSGSRQRKGSASTSGSISKIYGVEPNASAHEGLRQSVVAAGLDSVYEIVPTGIEDLAVSGTIAKGTVDCVVSVLCLCGIPEPQQNIRELYGYLKPGGRMYVFEHVCSRNWAVQLYQRFLNIFWPIFIGGCQLRRDTERYLRDAGPWTSIDVAHPVEEPWYATLPHIIGVLTK